MKLALPLLALVLFAGSCTTAFKSGQTPDDVYFSPERKGGGGNEYVQTNREDEYRSNQDRRRSRVDNDDYAYDDERYLRMKVRNRSRWSDLDYYYNDPYAAGYYSRSGLYSGLGLYGTSFWSPYSYWNAYSNWNYYYNPYYAPRGHVVVVNPNTSPVYNKPRTFNLNTFTRGGGTNGNPKRNGSSYQTFENRPSRNTSASSLGNDVRRTFGNSSSNSNSSAPAPSRSSSSSSSSSSSGGSRSSSAPVRKF
jgi:hypothetical protein